MELSAMDRCDRCPAAAMVAVDLGGSTLMFCGHHYRASEDGLIKAGAVKVTDLRDGPPPVELSAAQRAAANQSPVRPAPGQDASAPADPLPAAQPAATSAPQTQPLQVLHASPGSHVLKETLPDSSVRFTRTNSDGFLSDGPNGEPAVEVIDYRTKRRRMVEHYDSGRKQDSKKGEPAEEWYFSDGAPFAMRRYHKGRLNDGQDGTLAVTYLAQDGSVRQVESWLDGVHQLPS